jgi:hypothetical protein
VERLAQERSGAAALGGCLERVLHLTQDLRFTEHQRVQAGGDAEQMVRSRGVFMGKQMRQKRLARELVVLAEKNEQLLARTSGIGTCDVDLRSVAGREHDRFGCGRPGCQ